MPGGPWAAPLPPPEVRGCRSSTPPGIKYFGGGPVERMPFRWFHLCFTVDYRPGGGAVRWGNTWKYRNSRNIFVNGEINFNVTTEFLPEVSRPPSHGLGWVEPRLQPDYRGSGARLLRNTRHGGRHRRPGARTHHLLTYNSF